MKKCGKYEIRNTQIRNKPEWLKKEKLKQQGWCLGGIPNESFCYWVF